MFLYWCAQLNVCIYVAFMRVPGSKWVHIWLSLTIIYTVLKVCMMVSSHLWMYVSIRVYHYHAMSVTMCTWEWVSRFLLLYDRWCNSFCLDLKTIKNKIGNYNASYHNRSPCHGGWGLRSWPLREPSYIRTLGPMSGQPFQSIPFHRRRCWGQVPAMSCWAWAGERV